MLPDLEAVNLRNFGQAKSSNVDVGLYRDSILCLCRTFQATRRGCSVFGPVHCRRPHDRNQRFGFLRALAGELRIYLRVFPAELYSALVSQPSSRLLSDLSFCLVYSGVYRPTNTIVHPHRPDCHVSKRCAMAAKPP